MLIDGFTVAAQVVNFLILMGLLKYFLYDRVLRAMDERERHLASLRQEAETREIEAGRAMESHQQKIQELEDQRDDMMSHARQEANQHKHALILQAQQDVNLARQNWLESLDQEKTAFLQDLRQRIVTQVYEIARQALKDLANKDFSTHMVEVFLSRLPPEEDIQWERFHDVFGNRKPHFEIQSAFPLSRELEKQITSTLEARLGKAVDSRFTISPNLTGGIELKGAGYTVAWNLEQYLDSLNDHIGRELAPRGSHPLPSFSPSTAQDTGK